MKHRTLEEYKEEYIKNAITTREIIGVANFKVGYILRIINGDEYE